MMASQETHHNYHRLSFFLVVALCGLRSIQSIPNKIGPFQLNSRINSRFLGKDKDYSVYASEKECKDEWKDDWNDNYYKPCWETKKEKDETQSLPSQPTRASTEYPTVFSPSPSPSKNTNKEKETETNDLEKSTETVNVPSDNSRNNDKKKETETNHLEKSTETENDPSGNSKNTNKEQETETNDLENSTETENTDLNTESTSKDKMQQSAPDSKTVVLFPFSLTLQLDIPDDSTLTDLTQNDDKLLTEYMDTYLTGRYQESLGLKDDQIDVTLNLIKSRIRQLRRTKRRMEAIIEISREFSGEVAFSEDLFEEITTLPSQSDLDALTKTAFFGASKTDFLNGLQAFLNEPPPSQQEGRTPEEGALPFTSKVRYGVNQISDNASPIVMDNPADVPKSSSNTGFVAGIIIATLGVGVGVSYFVFMRRNRDINQAAFKNNKNDLDSENPYPGMNETWNATADKDANLFGNNDDIENSSDVHKNFTPNDDCSSMCSSKIKAYMDADDAESVMAPSLLGAYNQDDDTYIGDFDKGDDLSIQFDEMSDLGGIDVVHKSNSGRKASFNNVWDDEGSPVGF